MSANCPSCGGALKKVPQRKTKCPHCGEYMCVRTMPGDGSRRVVTAAVAEQIDREWEARGEQMHRDRVAGVVGGEGGLSRSALRGLLIEKMHDQSDRNAAMLAAAQLMTLEETDVQRDAAGRWYYTQQLMKMAESGVAAVMIRGSLDACPACSALAGREMPIREALEQTVPSPECDAVKRGRPCCAFWSPSIAGNPYGIKRTL